jgi:hypothetical protein
MRLTQTSLVRMLGYNATGASNSNFLVINLVEVATG